LRALPILRTTLLINLVVTVAAMTLAYRALRRADDYGRLVIRSHQTLQAAEETLRRAVDVETGARGFFLTHNAADLERYKTGRQFVPRPLEELTTMLAADGRRPAAEAVRTPLNELLTHLDKIVEQANRHEPLNEAESDAARTNMDALRAAIRIIRRSETDVLTARTERDERTGRRINWLLTLMTGITTLLLTMLVASLVYVTRPGAWRV
jgi:CHASE3 domain sensor protein